MEKSIFQKQYPFGQVMLPGRSETFVMQTSGPQWIIQIIEFKDQEQFKKFAYGKPVDVYTYEMSSNIAAQAVNPVQTVNITLDNMKEENAIQAQAERDALVWWLQQHPQ